MNMGACLIMCVSWLIRSWTIILILIISCLQHISRVAIFHLVSAGGFFLLTLDLLDALAIETITDTAIIPYHVVAVMWLNFLIFIFFFLAYMLQSLWWILCMLCSMYCNGMSPHFLQSEKTRRQQKFDQNVQNKICMYFSTYGCGCDFVYL